VDLFHQAPLLTSAGLNWSGLQLEYRREPPSEFPESSMGAHTITMLTHVPSPPRVRRILDGQCREEVVDVGEIVVVPAHIGHGVQWDTEGTFVMATLATEALARVIDPAAEVGQWSLRPQFSCPDPLVLQTLKALLAQIQRGAKGNRLYCESLGQTLMLHLLHHYGTVPQTPRAYSDGLSRLRLRRVLDYIHSHLDQDLSIAELAALLQLSPHYFVHLFKQAMGLSPYQYLLRQRVEQAKNLLKDPSLSIADVAYRVGFANQSHLNRHFKRVVGVTPGQYRRR
jgi:AraC family transcriptional regulator